MATKYNKIQCSSKKYAPKKAKKLPKVLGNKPRPPKKPDPTTQITINHYHKNIKPYIKEALDELLDIASEVIGTKLTHSSVDVWENEWSIEDYSVQTGKIEKWLTSAAGYKTMYEFCERWEKKLPGIEGTKELQVLLTHYSGSVWFSAKTYKPIEQAAEESQKYEKACASYEKRLAAWEEAKAAGVKTRKELADEQKANKLLARKAQLEKELKELGV